MGLWGTLGTIGGAVGGGLIGGPAGVAVGAGLGGTLGSTLDSGGGGFGASRDVNNEFRAVDPNGQVKNIADTGKWQAMQSATRFGRGYEDQQRLAKSLEQQAQGNDLVSARMLQQGLQQNRAAQISAAAGAAPENQAMAARNAAIQMGRIGQGISGQQAIAGAQERMAAQSQLGNVLAQQRALELQAATQGRQQALQGYQGIESNRTSRFGALAGSQTDPSTGERLVGAAKGAADLYTMWKDKEKDNPAPPSSSPYVSPAESNYGQGGNSGFAGLYSDRRLKTKVKSGDDDVKKLLRSLKAYKYRYKDGRFGEGDQLGVMAQDLEKSGIGRQAVIDTPRGKKVDAAKLAGALAAASANLNKRLEKLEKRR